MLILPSPQTHQQSQKAKDNWESLEMEAMRFWAYTARRGFSGESIEETSCM